MKHANRSNALCQVGTGLLIVTLAFAAGAGNFARADDGKGDGNNNEVRLRTQLAGGAIMGRRPSGNADFRMQGAPVRTRLKVEVEDVNLPKGTVLQVAVTHAGTTTMVGTLTLDAFGGGELDLDSQDGDSVPALSKGDSVTVSNAGSAILMGAF
jgi:hypothetical protein